jgi:hypothetical protein
VQARERGDRRGSRDRVELGEEERKEERGALTSGTKEPEREGRGGLSAGGRRGADRRGPVGSERKERGTQPGWGRNWAGSAHAERG